MAETLLAGALVLVTAYYAWQNHRMVKEMRAARAAQLLPKMLVMIHHRPAGHGFLRVVNAGPGPAIDVTLQLELEPRGPAREWSSKVVAPAESHDFIPSPKEEPNGLLHLDALTERYSHVRLLGTCRDALGGQHEIDERFEMREYWTKVKAAVHLKPDEWARDTVKHLERIQKDLHSIARDLQEIRRRGLPGRGGAASD